MGAEDGLSQNTAFSILFDSKGFMWIGTMNGLNRYDGYEFKIFRSSSESGHNFTNNRITELWEDKKGFIWLETYDGYYHYFNPESEIFTSIPVYKDTGIRSGSMQIFLQYSDDIVLLGSSESGFYFLKYDPERRTYVINQYPDKIDAEIRFIHKDLDGNIWTGSESGIFMSSRKSLEAGTPEFTRYLSGSFTSVCETAEEVWFGSANNGISACNKFNGSNRTFGIGPYKQSGNISVLYMTRQRKILAGIDGTGYLVTDSTGGNWKKISYHSRNPGEIFEDKSGNVWLTAVEFGATKLDMISLNSRYYELTPAEIRPLTDLERPRFFEDSNGTLWLGLHGSGLALYDRNKDSFVFFRNDPKNRNSIASNFVHCIAEDRYGQLWAGTGQVNGGIEKVILKNRAFEHVLPEKQSSDLLENVTRALIEDNNHSLWVGTKAGRLHLFDSTLYQAGIFLSLPGQNNESSVNITYSLFIDNRNYLWIGSKGYGLAVSSQPLEKTAPNHTHIRFRRFEYDPDDKGSISNNNIYSICQDKEGNIWVGTYGNGLNLVIDPWAVNTKFKRINQQNSNLSSNMIRHLMTDSKGNLWVATIFGINLLKREDILSGKYDFRVFVHNISDEKSLIYNDVIHIYEDSGGNLWFGTFGGGVDMTGNSGEPEVVFRHYGPNLVQGYGIIFGILEDDFGKIWLSSENGLICLDPVTAKSEVYNTFNGLGFNNFSENTCYRLSDGSLVFGGNGGFEVIRPERIIRSLPHEQIELTRFMLFNREVPIAGKDSPLKKSISFSDEIKLKHNQSSFSIDYSSLDFLDPAKTEYSYKLDNFDAAWNNVGSQHRATYTNLSPGKYVFRVRSMERNGRSASGERLLNIWITPPWHKTLPAYTLFGIIMILIAISIYRIISRINSYKNALIIEKKVNDYKLQFFTNISHEIRTPLTLIIGPLEDILADRDISGRKKMQMEIMLKNARRMLRLTNQLLDFRKVQNNKMTLKIRKIEIVAFTREIFDSFLPLASHKGIDCSFESEFTEHSIFADPSKLDIIIYNIISNALKFTCTGKKVTVKISKSELSDSTDISVTDEGPGIPQKDLANLFTRYTILNNSDLGGTGIGLALSWELAKLHGGNILVESTPGKGSTFSVRLPEGFGHFRNIPDFYPEDAGNVGFKHQNETIDEIENEESFLPDTTDKNMILVVEDNHEVLDYICQSLKSFFICIGARNGSEGLHLARTLNPDLIITDIMMPGMDGIEMTGVLKEDFNTSHIPVIMLTSKSEMTDQIKGIKTGAEAYITKPFSMEYLKTVASNLLSQREKIIARFLKEKPLEKAQTGINSKDEEFISKVVSFVEDHCSNTISIDDLAGECNVSRTVLYNKIKGLTGLSPLDFLRKIKLNMASRYIGKGYNVSEAAFRTGFTDVRYFSRLFKQQFGHLPSQHKADA